MPELASIAVNVALVLALALVARLVRSVMAFVARYRAASRTGMEGVPCVPTQFPLGAAWLLTKYPKEDAFAKGLEDYGDPKHGHVYMQLLDKKFLVPTHHEWIKEILNASPHHANFGEFKQIHEIQVSAYWLGWESVLFQDTAEHDKWLQLRLLLGSSFRAGAVRKLLPHMVAVNKRFRDYLRQELKRTGGAPIDWQTIVFPMTFDNFGRAAFSTNFGAIDALGKGAPPKLFRLFDDLMFEADKRAPQIVMMKPWLNMKYLWLPVEQNRKFKANAALYRNEMAKLINKRKQALDADPTAEFDDFLQTCIDAKDPDSGISFTEEELQHNLNMVMFAGHDTTGITLTFTMYAIAANPRVQKKLQEEVDAVLPDGAEPDASTYGKLLYTRNVLKEALRLYSPVTFLPRATQKDITVNGFTLPKGSECMISFRDVMTSPHNFERPLEFWPERFDKQYPFHAWMPFMHGRRTCIGMRFAEVSTAIAVSSFIQNWEFEVPDDYNFKWTAPSALARPAEKLRLIVRPRTQQQSSAGPVEQRLNDED